jgi:hypothetical protein
MWLVDTVGGSLKEQVRAGNAGVMVVVWGAAALMVTAAVLPLLALRGPGTPALNRG